MEVRLEDGRVVNVADDDPTALALLASGRAEPYNSANLPAQDPGNVNEAVVEAPAEVAETPERPKRRGRHTATDPETR